MAQDLELFLHQSQAGDLLRFPGPGSFIHEIYLQQLITQAGFEAEFERVIKQLPGWLEIWRHEGSLITDNSPNGREPYFCRPEFKKVATWTAPVKRKHEFTASSWGSNYCKHCNLWEESERQHPDCPGAPEKKEESAVKTLEKIERETKLIDKVSAELWGKDMRNASHIARAVCVPIFEYLDIVADAIKDDLRKEFGK